MQTLWQSGRYSKREQGGGEGGGGGEGRDHRGGIKKNSTVMFLTKLLSSTKSVQAEVIISTNRETIKNISFSRNWTIS